MKARGDDTATGRVESLVTENNELRRKLKVRTRQTQTANEEQAEAIKDAVRLDMELHALRAKLKALAERWFAGNIHEKQCARELREVLGES